MKHIILVRTAFFIFCVSSLWSQEGLSREETIFVSSSVYEVVIEKPDEGDILYEEELPWDLLPFHIRNDRYISIGTAFAVGPNLFLSAAHVFSPEERTLRHHIGLRDGNNRVYPVGQVLQYDNHRDFILFSTEGLDNTQWLNLSPDSNINEFVLAVGNAHGEGIIFRDGLLTSKTPERENGAWNWLRFSAAASPGNSGGPLLNHQGDVIGIITAKSENENLNYALPVSEIGALEPQEGVLHMNVRYIIPNIQHRHRNIADYPIPLPQDYEDLKFSLQALYDQTMEDSIRGFLEEKKGDLFPIDEGARDVLTDTVATLFPCVINEKDDSTWHIIQPSEINRSDLGNGGYLRAGTMWGDTLWQLELPEGEGADEYFEDPRRLMDMVLAGHKFTRSMGSAKIRITSFGEPESADWYQDRWGRRWLSAAWNLPFADRKAVFFALPTPSGAVGIMAITPASHAYAYRLDFQEMVNYMYMSFAGDFKQWQQYLANRGMISDLFRRMTFSYESAKSVHLKTTAFDLFYDDSLIGIGDQAALYMVSSFQQAGKDFLWDVSRVFLYEREQSDNYIALEKRFRPHDEFDRAGQNYWLDVVGRKYPFDNDPFVSKGNSFIYETRNIAAEEEINPTLNSVWTYYVAKEGERDDQDMVSFLMKLRSGFSLSEEEVGASVYGTGLDVSVSALTKVYGMDIFQAISLDKRDAVRQFINGRIDLEARNSEGRTPLMVAIRMEKQEIVNLLLEAGADLNVTDRYGHTPLLLSLRHLPEYMALKLLKRGADPDQRDKDGYSPLMEACRHEYAMAGDMLLGLGIDLEPVNSYGRSGLYYALTNGLDELAVALMDRGAPVSLAEDVSYTNFMTALKNAQASTCRLLMRKGTLLGGRSDGGWTPLMYALRYGKPGIAGDLIREEQDFQAANENGWTPLHFAARYGTLQNVKGLLGKGADPEAVTSRRTTPLMLSFYHEETREITDYLLNQGFDTNGVDSSEWTTLMIALRYGTKEQAWNVLQSTSQTGGKNENGWTPLMFAARNDHPDILRYLVEQGSPLQEANKQGLTALYLAAGYSDLETVRFLVEQGADVSVVSDSGYTPLMKALREGKSEIALYLLEQDSPIDGISETGWTPLMLSLRYCPSSLSEALVRRGASSQSGKTDNAWKSLHFAARYGTAELCRMIMEQGADVHAKTDFGYTPLHLAAMYNSEAAVLLIHKGADMNAQDSEGNTPLHKAADAGNKESAEFLLQAGAARHIRNNESKLAVDMFQDDPEMAELFSL